MLNAEYSLYSPEESFDMKLSLNKGMRQRLETFPLEDQGGIKSCNPFQKSWNTERLIYYPEEFFDTELSYNERMIAVEKFLVEKLRCRIQSCNPIQKSWNSLSGW